MSQSNNLQYFSDLIKENRSTDEVLALMQSPSFWNCLESDYVNKQEHSEFLDILFGMKVNDIEEAFLSDAKKINPEGTIHSWSKAVHGNVQTYIGLNPRQLQTPYSELLEMLNDLNLKDGEHVVDLGAGYGRMALIMSSLFSQSLFTGYEFVKERVDSGSAAIDMFGNNNVKLLCQDLFCDSFELPLAEYYFIYDYGLTDHIRKTLNQLRDIGLKKQIKVIARGRGCKSLIYHSHPWLSQVFEPEIKDNYTIFRNFD